MHHPPYMYKKDTGTDTDTGEKCRANRRVIESCFMNHLDESSDEEQNDPLSALDTCTSKVYPGLQSPVCVGSPAEASRSYCLSNLRTYGHQCNPTL